MKFSILSFVASFLFILSLSSFETRPVNIDPGLHKKKKNWTKTVWSYIDSKDSINQHIFKPLNEFFIGGINSDEDFSFEVMKTQKSAMKENLWNIILYHFHNGDLKMFLPWDPEIVTKLDNGYLLHEVSSSKFGTKPKANIDNDSLFKSQIKWLGVNGEELIDAYAEPYMNEFGEDSVVTDEYGNSFTIYPP